jgi:hypothetical protein
MGIGFFYNNLKLFGELILILSRIIRYIPKPFFYLARESSPPRISEHLKMTQQFIPGVLCQSKPIGIFEILFH